MKFTQSKLLIFTLALAAINTGCFGKAAAPATAAATPTATPAVSSTADIDGTYETPCFTNGPNSAVLAFKIDDGKSYQLFKYYEGSTTCTGSYTTIDTTTSDPVTEYPLTGTLTVVALTGIPSGFTVFEGTSVANVVTYGLFYRVDATHVQLLANDDVATNHINYGAAWTDWTAGSTIIADWVADPTGYAGAAQTSNIPLVASDPVVFP